VVPEAAHRARAASWAIRLHVSFCPCNRATPCRRIKNFRRLNENVAHGESSAHAKKKGPGIAFERGQFARQQGSSRPPAYGSMLTPMVDDSSHANLQRPSAGRQISPERFDKAKKTLASRSTKARVLPSA
jgi:hypothetical protein